MRALLIGAIWFLVIGFETLRRSNRELTFFPPSPFVLIVLGLCLIGWLASASVSGLIASKSEKWSSWQGIGGTTFVSSIVVLLILLFAARHIALAPSVPSFKSTDEQMKYLADLATKWVKADLGVKLDYSFESIRTIEEQLARISTEVDKAHPQKGTFGTAAGYGAYIGEVFRRHGGGTWATDHPVAGPASYPLTTMSNGTIFPVGWCWKRLTIGEEDNVYRKARSFLEKREILTNATPAK